MEFITKEKQAFFDAVKVLNEKLATVGYMPVLPEVNKETKKYFVTLKKGKEIDLSDFDL